MRVRIEYDFRRSPFRITVIFRPPCPPSQLRQIIRVRLLFCLCISLPSFRRSEQRTRGGESSVGGVCFVTWTFTMDAAFGSRDNHQGRPRTQNRWRGRRELCKLVFASFSRRASPFESLRRSFSIRGSAVKFPVRENWSKTGSKTMMLFLHFFFFVYPNIKISII